MTHLYFPGGGGGGGGSGLITSVSDTDSIDLTVTAGDLTADLKLSSDPADPGFIIVQNTIQPAPNEGLRSQVNISNIRAVFSAIPPLVYNSFTGTFNINDASADSSIQGVVYTYEPNQFNGYFFTGANSFTILANDGLSFLDYTTASLTTAATLNIPQANDCIGKRFVVAHRAGPHPVIVTPASGQIFSQNGFSPTYELRAGEVCEFWASGVLNSWVISSNGSYSSPLRYGLVRVHEYNQPDAWNFVTSDGLITLNEVNATTVFSDESASTVGNVINLPQLTPSNRNCVIKIVLINENASFNTIFTVVNAAPGDSINGSLTSINLYRTNDYVTLVGYDGYGWYIISSNIVPAFNISPISSIPDPNGLTYDPITKELYLHEATSVSGGVVSTGFQTFSGSKVFNDPISFASTINVSLQIFKNPLAANASFNDTVSFVGTPATAGNLQSASATLDGQYYDITVEVIGVSSFRITATFQSDLINYISDHGNLALLSDSGTGFYVSKATNSNIITFKNRTGLSVPVRIRSNTRIINATAWS